MLFWYDQHTEHGVVTRGAIDGGDRYLTVHKVIYLLLLNNSYVLFKNMTALYPSWSQHSKDSSISIPDTLQNKFFPIYTYSNKKKWLYNIPILVLKIMPFQYIYFAIATVPHTARKCLTYTYIIKNLINKQNDFFL